MAAAAADEVVSTQIWSATTNWIASEGSLHDSISFDTSENIENDQECKPLLLLRPDGDDPPPCEITIYFTEKHEIHRIYVRSTARVYEIYYSSDHEDINKEYLCTVRCGAAIEELISEGLNGCQGSDNGNSVIPGHVARSDSNTSDEDGWVQVKSPGSLPQDDKEYFVAKKCASGRNSPKMQIHYEATAEISDYNPCFSITLRLLSIHTHNCVHVEEIYVYADPVESCDPDPPVAMGHNSEAGSMFAMLVPSIMQLSKSLTGREKSFSDEARVLKHHCGMEKSEHTVSSTENFVAQEASSVRPPDKNWSPNQEQTRAKAVKFQETTPQQMPDSHVDQNNKQAYTRIEKVLDDLVLKVGRVEAFCSRFEENMLTPFNCMEKRIQQLEQKLDALAVKSQSSVQCKCLKVASLESNEYNSNNEDGNIRHTEQREDTSIRHTEQREDTTFIGTTSPVDDIAPSVLEPQRHPGLIIKAPEFLNEDDEYFNTDDTLNPLMEDIPKNKKSSSIDSALASSLIAFLTSTTVKSPNPVPIMTAISQESVNSGNSALDSLAVVPTDGAGNLSDKFAIKDNGCDSLDAEGKGSIVDAELSSDPENTGCGKADAETECTAFDDPLSVTNAEELQLPVALASQSGSGFIVMPLDLPNRYNSFNCDNPLGSPELDCLEDPVSITRFRQTVPPLAEFLSSTTVQCPQSIPYINAPSVSFIIDNNELSVSIVEVTSGGADVLGIENQDENAIKNDAYLDLTLSMPKLEASFEEEDHTLFKLNGGVSQNGHGEDGIDDNGAEKAVLHGFDPHNKGCTEDSNKNSSSIHGNLIKQMLDTEWSVGGSSRSSIEISAVTDHSQLQAASNNYECNKASEGHSWPWESPNKEVEDVICNVKFSSDGNWISRLPLELLLGEMPDARPQEASTSGADGSGIDIEQKLTGNSSLTLGSDSVDDADGSFLLEVTPHSSFECTGNELQGPSEI